MNFPKYGCLIFIFFAWIIFYFWGIDIGNGLKETGEKLFLLFEKWIWIPFSKFFDESLTNLWYMEMPDFVKDPVLNFILQLLLTLICLLLFVLITIFLCIIWAVLFLIKVIFALTRAIGLGIAEALVRIKDFSLTGYILSTGVLASLSGGFFYFIIFPRLCQIGETILALTIGEFRYHLHRRNKKKLKQLENKEKKGELIEMEDESRDLQREIILIKKESPELLEGIPPAVFEEKGFLEEIYERFKIRRKEKTLKAIISYIGRRTEVWEKLLKAYKTRKDLEIERRRTGAQLERIDLEEEVERLKLEEQKLQLEKNIQTLKKEIKEIAQGVKIEDKFLQKTENKIKELKARGVGIKMVLKERDEILSDPELQKYPEIYQKIKNMWDNLIIEFSEK